MKISWAVFRLGYDWENTGLKLVVSDFDTERQAKKYVQHPDNLNKGSFIILEVIEVLRKK